MYLIWDWVDVNKNGNFSFKNATAPEAPDRPGSGGPFDYDEERQKLLDVEDITIMNTQVKNSLMFYKIIQSNTGRFVTS